MLVRIVHHDPSCLVEEALELDLPEPSVDSFVGEVAVQSAGIVRPDDPVDVYRVDMSV